MKRIVPGMMAALIGMPLILSFETMMGAAQARKGSSEKSSVTLTVLNPQGSVKKSRELAPRLETLKGKKVAMWLSATPDEVFAGKGAELYDILEKMLKEKFADIQIINYRSLPMKFAPEKEVIAAIEKAKPDAVIEALGG